jgi:hypothetical protein
LKVRSHTSNEKIILSLTLTLTSYVVIETGPACDAGSADVPSAVHRKHNLYHLYQHNSTLTISGISAKAFRPVFELYRVF